MMEGTASWSMSWGDGVPESMPESALLSVTMPPGQMLVASIQALPSPRVSSQRRSTYLCVGGADQIAVRAADGSLVWAEHGGAILYPDREREVQLPDDRGGEARGMVDGFHLVEWLSAEDYEVVGDQVRGTSSSYGRFTADLHPEHRFVLRVMASRSHVGRPLAETTNHRVSPLNETLMAAQAVDPTALKSLLGR